MLRIHIIYPNVPKIDFWRKKKANGCLEEIKEEKEENEIYILSYVIIFIICLHLDMQMVILTSSCFQYLGIIFWILIVFAIVFKAIIFAMIDWYNFAKTLNLHKLLCILYRMFQFLVISFIENASKGNIKEVSLDINFCCLKNSWIKNQSKLIRGLVSFGLLQLE